MGKGVVGDRAGRPGRWLVFRHNPPTALSNLGVRGARVGALSNHIQLSASGHT